MININKIRDEFDNIGYYSVGTGIEGEIQMCEKRLDIIENTLSILIAKTKDLDLIESIVDDIRSMS